jgi:hypothetical protein
MAKENTILCDEETGLFFSFNAAPPLFEAVDREEATPLSKAIATRKVLWLRSKYGIIAKRMRRDVNKNSS